MVLAPGLVCDETVWREQLDDLGSYHAAEAGSRRWSADHGLHRSGPYGRSAAGRGASPLRPRRPLHGGQGGTRGTMARARTHHRLALLDTGIDALPAGEAGENEGRPLSPARHRSAQGNACPWQGMVAAHGPSTRLSDTTLMDPIHQMIARAPLAQFEAQIEALLGPPRSLRPVGESGCPPWCSAATRTPGARSPGTSDGPAHCRRMLVDVPDAGTWSRWSSRRQSRWRSENGYRWRIENEQYRTGLHRGLPQPRHRLRIFHRQRPVCPAG